MGELFAVPKLEPPQKQKQQPPDWQEREQALNIRQSWIVEAPAGSGKTGLLIQRYLKLLADESVESPEQVLAITFTVKATAEMRERVLEQLEAAARGDDLRNETEFEHTTRELADAVLRRNQKLKWNLLEHPRRLKIRTIDSVCSEIARLLPVLSGGGGRLSPADDSVPMYHEAARQTMMQLGGTDAELDEALRTILLHRDGSMADCERLLVEMLPLRNQWAELVPLGKHLNDAVLNSEVLPKLQQALAEAICAGLTRLATALPNDALQRMVTLAGEFAELPPYKPEIHPFAVCRGIQEAPEETVQHLERWRALVNLLVKKDGGWRGRFHKNDLGVEVEREHVATVKSLVDELRHHDDILKAVKGLRSLPPAVYPEEQWRVAKALFRVLNRALAELQVIFALRGKCDFAELGLLAKTALEREGAIEDLSAALGMKAQHLLVDEVQDTSTGQYALLELLTQGWDGQSQTVFLVGDPKQSIYLFRQARVERFVRTMQTRLLGELPLECLRLTANFRSQSGLVDAFNEDFSLLFPREVSPASPEEVPYVEARAVRSPSKSAQNLIWHTGIVQPDQSKEGRSKARRRQAKANASEVRSIIEHWRKKPLPKGRNEPWKIAVLVRSRNLLGEIVANFKDDTHGTIPFRAVEIEALGERQEVLDLFALTRALLHPADRVAWFAVLRAPWCGLELAELHLLAGADNPAWAERNVADVVEERGDLLSEESCMRLIRIWPTLQAAEQRRGKSTTAQWVEWTWRSLGGDLYLQPEEIANVQRYLRLLDEVEERIGTMDLALLQRMLKNLYAEPAVGTGLVDLMTIHKSKGLEWDVVIVPGLEKKDPVNREKLLLWNEIDSADTQTAQIVLAPIAGRGEGSKGLNAWLRGIDRTREAAERKRVFYVACTRAREELHLFASPEMTAKGNIAHPYGSLLDTAWPAAERHFAAPLKSSSTAKAIPEAQATLFEMSISQKDKDKFSLDIAAGASEIDEPSRSTVLRRFPLKFDPASRFTNIRRLSYGEDTTEAKATQFDRPEGSFEARSLGNAVHAFVERMAKRLADGVSLNALSHEVANWSPRIAAVLRGDGLPPSTVERLTLKAKTSLSNILHDKEGQWLITPHKQASSEFALTSWVDRRRNGVRLDRVFWAGEEPLAPGNEWLWIIDYKTTAHGFEGVEEFLSRERTKYEAQMEAYARVLKQYAKVDRVRIGLYYPMLPKLIWWKL